MKSTTKSTGREAISWPRISYPLFTHLSEMYPKEILNTACFSKSGTSKKRDMKEVDREEDYHHLKFFRLLNLLLLPERSCSGFELLREMQESKFSTKRSPGTSNQSN